MGHLRLMSVWVLSMLLSLPFAVQAASTGLAVNIEGTAKIPNDIAGTYNTQADGSKSYTITPKTTANGAKARVEAGDNPDWITLHNAVITANHDGVDGHIYYWVQLDGPPTGTVVFDVVTNGTLMRKIGLVWVGATGNWLQVIGSVQNPVTDLANGTGGSWICIGNAGEACPPSHTWYVNSTSQGTISMTDSLAVANISSDRLHKVEITFHLDKKNDQLTFVQTYGPKIQAAQGGGGGGKDDGGVHPRCDEGEVSAPKCCPCK